MLEIKTEHGATIELLENSLNKKVAVVSFTTRTQHVENERRRKQTTTTCNFFINTPEELDQLKRAIAGLTWPA